MNPEDGKKDPWFIHATGPLLAAGLWEDTSPLLPDGNLGTFTIITGDSSGVSADIHDRMPVWLQAGQIDQWLAASPDDAMAMLLASEPPGDGGLPRQPRGEHAPEQPGGSAAAGRIAVGQPNPSGTSVRSTMKIVAFCGPIVTPPTGKVLVIRVCENVSCFDMKILLSLVMWKASA